jgi:hypothetical protein
MRRGGFQAAATEKTASSRGSALPWRAGIEEGVHVSHHMNSHARRLCDDMPDTKLGAFILGNTCNATARKYYRP